MMRGTPLYNSMINDVIKTDTYKQVKKEYANVYSSEIQFKEEAITKLITESVIQQHQKGTKLTFDEYTNINNRINRWFNKVMSFIKDLLAKYSVNEYDVAAMKLLFNDTSDLSLNNINNNEEMYQLETNDISSKINDAINKIKSRHIGYFKTELEAHKAWQARKHEYALQLADLQSDERVAEVLRTKYAPDKDWTNR
jgi:hypothetical protein